MQKFIATHHIMEGKAALPPWFSKTMAAKQNPYKRTQIPNIESQVTFSENSSSIGWRKPRVDDLMYSISSTQTLRCNIRQQYIQPSITKGKMSIFNANRYTILSESVQLLIRFYGEDVIKSEVLPKVSELRHWRKAGFQKKENSFIDRHLKCVGWHFAFFNKHSSYSFQWSL